MDSGYFRTVASRCRKSARDCFDLYAKEEFRRLANELDARAVELELGHKPQEVGEWPWQHAQSSGHESFRR